MKKITSDFKGRKALVADDYLINQELAKELLELMGCDVDVAEDGKIALEKYNTNSYDVIMMDVQMPEVDGYEATKKIREIEASSDEKHTLIIAITANAMSGDKQKCLDAGMDDYISKPIKGENLQAKLAQYFTVQNQE